MQTVAYRKRGVSHPSLQIGVHAHSTISLDLLLNTASCPADVNLNVKLVLSVAMNNSVFLVGCQAGSLSNPVGLWFTPNSLVTQEEHQNHSSGYDPLGLG